MSTYTKKITISRLFTEYKSLLRGFGLDLTPEIQHRIIELYPNYVAIENYVLQIIKDYLDRLDELYR